ncbi:MAG: hypothetical protein Kow0068_00710 [Marinilabiliales bacterium]
MFVSCNQNNDDKQITKDEKKAMIDETIISNVIDTLKSLNDKAVYFRIERGVNQVAALWRQSDGTTDDFKDFCLTNFVGDDNTLDKVFNRLSENFEIIKGGFNKMYLDLLRPLHLDIGDILDIDYMFGGYDPSAHFKEDFYNNKIGLYIALNFPFYTLEEKNSLGQNWSRKQWAYARMGDMFISRVSSEILINISKTQNEADTYISEYNIFMGCLRDNEDKKLFPDDLKLITHWGLRDELKSNYITENGFAKQKLIYEVMKDIIFQDIPSEVINNDKYQWNPYKDKLYLDGKEIEFKKEDNIRYKYLLENFKALKAEDEFSPHYPDYIKRKFDEEMEMSQKDVEQLFIELLSSPQVKKVAELIKQRLGRDLEPFDIWYNGFRGDNTNDEVTLTKITREKYPNPSAFKEDIPNILMKLGWEADRANEIASAIAVDPARGAGHAWGAEMKSDVAHLRTRIGPEGMDYKGYNIAVHELGHNVEQTITLRNVDYYMLHGVPNTAFTEAIAFIFQKRDLMLLGVEKENSNKTALMALDDFWSCYEIMGVSLVDMYVWQWMYEHPEATPAELKEAVITIAKDVWNKYYADIFGVKDQPILAIYSHMIDSPLYLSAYPIGLLINFQIEQYIEDKKFNTEIERILVNGRLTPDVWMNAAVKDKLSNQPLLNAVDKALNIVD